MARPTPRLTLLALALALLAACSNEGAVPPPGPDPTPPPAPIVKPTPAQPGQTEFTSEDFNRAQGGDGRLAGGRPAAESAPTGAPPSASAPGAAQDASKNAAPMAPSGRVGEVEEGDIYKVVGDRLYYLNTYKGFIIYDVKDPKKPARVSRLPVFGYPIEMFVEGNTVYALLRDALYLTQSEGKLEFARHNVSQLVTIDISDAANPRVLKTFDITGQLREGVSRKIANTIYVVSYWSRGYWWGWHYENDSQGRQDQAFVYSFDVANPANPQKVGELKIFEGGAVNFHDPKTGASFNRNFSQVAISATSNALMVVENWSIYASGRVGGAVNDFDCRNYYYNSDQQAVVSIIDISDPKGAIRAHTKFETIGQLGDQFKQTYVHDPATGKGTYYGIFARNAWASGGCGGASYVQNAIESWDVTNGAAPARLGRLDFGKPQETVRGTAFDVDRKVAYAITARQIDPLYAISIADPARMQILSQIDDLSGDISVFRLVGDKKFLLAVGRDNSINCTGFDDTNMMGGRGSNSIAVSIVDAQDPAKLRFVQRRCVKIEGADWINSEVAWNLDQAHKMLGMHSDGEVNVITVPISYSKRVDRDEWWSYTHETAVGIMSWDLAAYDPAKTPVQQTVIKNYGTFIHPNGEVRRSVLFKHPTLGQRMMANLSDTHISLANIQDLAKPVLESVVEVAPYLNEIFRFGGHILEQVQPRGEGYWDPNRSLVEFRVKAAGGSVEEKAPVATFVVGQVQRAVKHGDKLVVFRYVDGDAGRGKVAGGVYTPPKSEAVVYDLSDPTKPRKAGRVDMPVEAFPQYRFYCGGFGGAYWFDDYYGGSNSWVDTAYGLVVARSTWDQTSSTQRWSLMFLDLRNPDAPKLGERTIDLGKDAQLTGLVVDTIDGRGFYLGYRTYLGEAKREDGTVYYRYKDFAARYELVADRWAQTSALNVPGRVLRTFRSADDERLLLTSDSVGRWITDPQSMQGRWASWTRASLLREILLNGRPAAELLDDQVFENLRLASLVADGDKMFVNGARGGGYFYGRPVYTDGPVAVGGVAASSGAGGAASTKAAAEDMSDRLMVFDLASKKLDLVYDSPTRMYNVQLMGVHQGRLFANLSGDGILILDVRNAAQPTGLQFARTLGYATHIEFSGEDAYVASGFFGSTHVNLATAPGVPKQ